MQFHVDKQDHQFVKMFHFEKFDVFDFITYIELFTLRKLPTSILNTTYVDV